MNESSVLRAALNQEVNRLVDLAALNNVNLSATSPCGEWTVEDVLDHVAATPLLVARNLSDHFGLDHDTSAPQGDSQHRLAVGSKRLAAALAPLADHDLDTEMPGPFGPLLGRSALSLALTEITLHRCDIELAVGDMPAIPDDYVEYVLDTLVDWLLLLSSGGVPAPPGLRLVIDAHGLQPQTIEHSDHGWTRAADDRSNTPVMSGAPSGLVLFLSGRLAAGEANVTSTDSAIVAALKEHLPGP